MSDDWVVCLRTAHTHSGRPGHYGWIVNTVTSRWTVVHALPLLTRSLAAPQKHNYGIFQIWPKTLVQCIKCVDTIYHWQSWNRTERAHTHRIGYVNKSQPFGMCRIKRFSFEANLCVDRFVAWPEHTYRHWAMVCLPVRNCRSLLARISWCVPFLYWTRQCQRQTFDSCELSEKWHITLLWPTMSCSFERVIYTVCSAQHVANTLRFLGSTWHESVIYGRIGERKRKSFAQKDAYFLFCVPL